MPHAVTKEVDNCGPSAWLRMFYKHTFYSLRPPPETGILLLDNCDVNERHLPANMHICHVGWAQCSRLKSTMSFKHDLELQNKVKTPIHDNIRELVTWECKEYVVKS